MKSEQRFTKIATWQNWRFSQFYHSLLSFWSKQKAYTLVLILLLSLVLEDLSARMRENQKHKIQTWESHSVLY
jgi:hypothetical protein